MLAAGFQDFGLNVRNNRILSLTIQTGQAHRNFESQHKLDERSMLEIGTLLSNLPYIHFATYLQNANHFDFRHWVYF